jgi:hypothetical protein
MTRAGEGVAPSTYRLRVDGHLGDHWAAWFAGFTLSHEDDGTTALTGVVADQAQLHGLLSRVRDLGVTLLSVEVLEGSVPSSDDARTARPGQTR